MDTELVIRAQRGDQAAFAEIASATYARLHSFALGILRGRPLLERGFRDLPVDQRAVLVLRHLVGLPLHEVARVLDIPTGTARSRLYHALQSMRATLDADGRTTVGLRPATQEVTRWPLTATSARTPRRKTGSAPG